MRWERVFKVIDAIQLVADLIGKDGLVVAKEGDWLVTEGDEQFFLNDNEFKKEFRPKYSEPPVMVPYITGPDPVIYGPNRPIPYYPDEYRFSCGDPQAGLPVRVSVAGIPGQSSTGWA